MPSEISLAAKFRNHPAKGLLMPEYSLPEFSLAHLSDADLTRDLAAIVTRDRVGTVLLLAHLAEFDARKLFRSAGYPSMFAYCVGELHFSEGETARRIQSARAAKRFPALYAAVAAGRLHLTAVSLLAPHLSHENASELIEAATHRGRDEIGRFLARRFPESLTQPGSAVMIRALPPAGSLRSEPPAAPLFESTTPPSISEDTYPTCHVPQRHNQHRLGDVEEGPGSPAGSKQPPQPDQSRAKGSIGSPDRFLIRLTITSSTHDKLREAQALLSHALPSGDVALVLDRALDMLITHLRRRKIGAEPTQSRPAVRGGAEKRGVQPREGPGSTSTSPRSRYIPAHIRSAVWERDQGQCTYTSAEGRRCGERRFLEFDHIVPVASGGTSTFENTRLRCRAHNQYEAERAFGAAFMDLKRNAMTRKRGS